MSTPTGLEKIKTSLALTMAQQAESHRQELLDHRNLARQILFDGNRPYLNPEYRKRIVGATLASAGFEVRAHGSLGALKKNVRLVIDLWPNVLRIRINHRYRDRLVARLNAFDAQMIEIARLVDRSSQPELWEVCSGERLGTLSQDLDHLWHEYRREYVAAGWRAT